MIDKEATSIFIDDFDTLNFEERKQKLNDHKVLTPEELAILTKDTSLKIELADQLIENVIGFYPLPLAIASNFLINQRDYIIPMVIEETSVVRALSRTAKWLRSCGEITTKTIGQGHIGQIQIPSLKNKDYFTAMMLSHQLDLIDLVNTNVALGLKKRGGGMKKIELRFLKRLDGGEASVIHVVVDTKDAMGANIINQICHFLKPHIEKLTRETVGMCILTNLVDTKLTQANVLIKNINPRLGHAICEGSHFAQIDPYRAATNNKGVMNGIDSVLIATGNDWRAVEAGVHAFAAHTGIYKPITRWQMQGKDLHGQLEAPIIVGIVGGMTRVHPIAQICLKLLKVKSSNELAEVIGAVGLVQNLAAVRALMTTGIVRGHMNLHLANLAMAAGASEEELRELKPLLNQFFKEHHFISEQQAKDILQQLRAKKT